jgi:hypothetical protein
MKKIVIVLFIILFSQSYAQFSGKQSSGSGDSKITSGSTAYSLGQNYPNPFNSMTTITYTIPEDEHVSLKLYNIIGVEILTLKNQFEEKGNHTIKFNSSKLPSGVYFYVIRAGSFNQMKKLTIMK